MTTEYFENVSRILITKAADFSYYSHNDDFLSLGHLNIFRSTCVPLYAGTTKFTQSALLLNQPQNIKFDVISCHLKEV